MMAASAEQPGVSEVCALMVKAPVPGEVKTRLAKTIGPERAASLYACFIKDMMERLLGDGVTFHLSHAPTDRLDELERFAGATIPLVEQRGKGFGQRLRNIFETQFAQGSSKVVALASDVPDLPLEHLRGAFDLLDSNDAVIGPCPDGGYYLIGFNKTSYRAEAFEDIPWSTGEVLPRTISKLSTSNVAMLPEWRDVDTLDDLRALHGRGLDRLPMTRDLISGDDELGMLLVGQEKKRTGISVIVPVLHETESINMLIEHLRGLPSGDRVEVIIVDGAEEEDTIGSITREDVIKASSRQGRAFQMNTGAGLAKGDVLLFLHADTLLPRNGLKEIEDRMRDPYLQAGSFKLMFHPTNAYLRVIEVLNDIRLAVTGVPYGDHAIFLRRGSFLTLGGYREILFMEDVELMRRAKRKGIRPLIIGDRASTSSRRFRDDGYVKHSARYFAFHMLYWMGVSPDWMGRRYRK